MRKSPDDLSEITRSQLIKYQITPLARSLPSQREGHKTFRICKREFLIEVASLLDFPSLSDQSLRQVIFCGTLVLYYSLRFRLLAFCLSEDWLGSRKGKKSFFSPFFPPPCSTCTCRHHETKLKKNCHHVILVNATHSHTVLEGQLTTICSLKSESMKCLLLPIASTQKEGFLRSIHNDFLRINCKCSLVHTCWL